MDKKKKQQPWKSILIYGVILLVAVLLIYWLVADNNKGKKITYSEFEQMVEAGQVADIDLYGYTVRIRKVDGVKEEAFPKSVDAYCTVMDYRKVHDLISEYNDKYSVKDGENFTFDEDGNRVMMEGRVYIDYNEEFEGESLLSSLLPYVSVIVVIVLGVFLFKSMSGNSKGFGFGKSKAKLVVSSNVRFKDVAGAEEEKQELKEIVEFLKNPTRFTELGARIPKGVLLVGPPGTGKTLLAKAVAGESKVPFFSISGSDFVELYVGVGASRVRDLFENAKANSPCIVFIDEIDAVGRQRGAGLGGGNDEREQTLNQLLVEMDGFESNSGIIVLAATNRADVLDPALTRPGRFDRQVYVHLPDVKGREEIIKVHAKNKPMSDDVDFQRIARLTSGLAGADIENLLNEAALLTARDGRYKITMVDIQEGLNKVLMGPKKVSRVIKEQDKIITAIHEAGHAILAQALENCDNVQEISIIPRGHAGGYTLTFDEQDRSHMTKNKLLDTITMMLGGRTAEEIMLDDITTGASNDIERATKVARRMVAEWGMSDEIGLISFGEGGEIFVGRDYQRQVPYGQELASKIDKEVKDIIDTAHATAKKIIESKRDVLEKVRDILLDKETIYKEEFEMIYNGASVEEVKIAIDKKEEEKRQMQEKAKKEAIEEHKNRDIKQRVETAEALAKAGVISKQDLENIKKEAEKEYNELNKQLANEETNTEVKENTENQDKPQDESDKK
ncbi:MAG: ATP-dependent zinc metalloprotease FtsH [Clostridiales bacterium]|nr:ATP-dependent zinc metalloprotease FtsH [Clostridiales bacterium]